MDVFADSNLFLSYAIDFEEDHAASVRFFHGNYSRFTGIRVRMELNKIKKRRRKLYRDLENAFSQNVSPAQFQPTVALKDNDLDHLRQLLERIGQYSPPDLLVFVRRIGRIIDQGIINAFSKLAGPLVPISTDLVCIRQIELCVDNANDAGILVDALCWAERRRQSIFCTADYKDLVNKRNTIYRMICRIRGYDAAARPLVIMSLDEFLYS